MRISKTKMDAGLDTLIEVLKARIKGEPDISVRRYMRAKIRTLSGDCSASPRKIRSIAFLY